MVQTLMLFPGVSVSMLIIPGVKDNWKVTTMNLIFNCFDTAGRYLTEIKILHEKCILFISICRFL